MFTPKSVFLLEREAFRLVFGEEEKARLRELLEFPFAPLHTIEDARRLGPFGGVEVLVSGWGTPSLGEEALSLFPDLRLIAHGGGSVKGFATGALWEREIRVTSSAYANAIPVAEFALSQIIFSLKQGWHRIREIERDSLYLKEDETTQGVYGSTVGIISFGMTGRLLRKLLRSLEVEVLVYDPFLDEAMAETEEVSLVSLEEIFRRSDVVSCHTPQLSETIGMIRGRHLESMKKGATFLNTARGHIVVEEELIQVLKKRPDLFALLDVTETEPPLSGSPLYQMNNVVLTPHIAGSVGKECRRMGRFVISEIERYLRGDALVGEVVYPELKYMA